MKTNRPYQNDAHTCILKLLPIHSKPIALLLGTGSGKTFTMAQLVAKDLKAQFKRIWILAHQDPLPSQWSNTLDECGIGGALEVGSIVSKDTRSTFKERLRSNHLDQPIVIVMNPTLIRRLVKIPDRLLPDLIIVDECHKTGFHDITRALRLRCEALHGDRFREIGVTATPLRHPKDSLQFEDLYPKSGWIIPEGSSYHDFTVNGWWKPRAYESASDRWNADLAKSLSDGIQPGEDGEINDSKQSLIFIPMSDRAVEEWESQQTEGLKRQTFWATCGRNHAIAIKEALERKGYSAVIVMGEDKTKTHKEDDDRNEILRKYENCEFQHLIVVGCLREGYDCPPISCVVLFRIFGCYHDILQICGRGFRPYFDQSGQMINCLVLDMGLNFGEYPYPDNYDPLTYKNSKRGFIDLAMEICSVCNYNHKTIPRPVHPIDRTIKASTQMGAYEDGLEFDDRQNLCCHNCGQAVTIDLHAAERFGQWRKDIRKAIAMGEIPPRAKFKRSGIAISNEQSRLATIGQMYDLGIWAKADGGGSAQAPDFAELKKRVKNRQDLQLQLFDIEAIKHDRIAMLPPGLVKRSKQTISEAIVHARNNPIHLDTCIKGAIQICYLRNDKPSRAFSVFPDNVERQVKNKMFKAMAIEAVTELAVSPESTRAIGDWLQNSADKIMTSNAEPKTRYAQCGTITAMGDAIGVKIFLKDIEG